MTVTGKVRKNVMRERSLDPTEPESICPASVATLYAFVEE